MATIGLSKPYYAVYSNTGTTVSYANGGVMGKATEANIEVETTRTTTCTRTIPLQKPTAPSPAAH